MDEKLNHVAKEDFHFDADQMLKVEVKEVRTSLYIFRIIGSGQ